MLTLQEWLDEADASYWVKSFDSGSVCLPDMKYLGLRSGLWHLSDYVVSSVTAGTIWLAPKSKGGV